MGIGDRKLDGKVLELAEELFIDGVELSPVLPLVDPLLSGPHSAGAFVSSVIDGVGKTSCIWCRFGGSTGRGAGRWTSTGPPDDVLDRKHQGQSLKRKGTSAGTEQLRRVSLVS